MWSSNDRLWDRPQGGFAGPRLHTGVKPFHDRLWPMLARENFSFALGSTFCGNNRDSVFSQSGQRRCIQLRVLITVLEYVYARLTLQFCVSSGLTGYPRNTVLTTKRRAQASPWRCIRTTP